MKVLVCGGRDFTSYGTLCKKLDELDAIHGFEKVIHGGARGADRLSGDWAFARGIYCNVYEANWEKHGPAAGPIRNQRMLDEGKPDLVVAFPGGKGTADMVRRARSRGIEVMEIAE